MERNHPWREKYSETLSRNQVLASQTLFYEVMFKHHTKHQKWLPYYYFVAYSFANIKAGGKKKKEREKQRYVSTFVA